MRPTLPRAFALILAASLAFASGCRTHSTAGRTITDAATIVAAGAAGYAASDKDPVVAAGSAVAALGVKRFMESKADKERMEELDQAYKRGLAQQAKVADAAIQKVQSTGRPEAALAETDEDKPVAQIPVTLPERVINGVRVNATQEMVPVTNP